MDRNTFCIILFLSLQFVACNSDKNGLEDTHLGGCILLTPTGEIPTNIYHQTGIIEENENILIFMGDWIRHYTITRLDANGWWQGNWKEV